MSLLLSLWREAAIAALILIIVGLWTYIDSVKAERDEAQSELNAFVEIAKRDKRLVEERSANTIKTLKAEHQVNLKRAEQNAWNNFVATYGHPADWVSPLPANPRPGSPANNPGPSDGASPQPLAPPPAGLEAFVGACATDAATLAEFQKWATLNQIPVEQE